MPTSKYNCSPNRQLRLNSTCLSSLARSPRITRPLWLPLSPIERRPGRVYAKTIAGSAIPHQSCLHESSRANVNRLLLCVVVKFVPSAVGRLRNDRMSVPTSEAVAGPVIRYRWRTIFWLDAVRGSACDWSDCSRTIGIIPKTPRPLFFSILAMAQLNPSPALPALRAYRGPILPGPDEA